MRFHAWVTIPSGAFQGTWCRQCHSHVSDAPPGSCRGLKHKDPRDFNRHYLNKVKTIAPYIFKARVVYPAE